MVCCACCRRLSLCPPSAPQASLLTMLQHTTTNKPRFTSQAAVLTSMPHTNKPRFDSRASHTHTHTQKLLLLSPTLEASSGSHQAGADAAPAPRPGAAAAGTEGTQRAGRHGVCGACGIWNGARQAPAAQCNGPALTALCRLPSNAILQHNVLPGPPCDAAVQQQQPV